MAAWAACVGLLGASGAWAAEGAATEYVGGFMGFAAGYIPEDPGLYLANDLYYYHGSASVAPAGGRVAAEVSTDMYLDTLTATVMTRHRFLGGDFGYGLALTLGHLDMSAAVNPLGLKSSADTFGLGDLIVTPAVLGWHSGDWHSSLAVSLYAPTGQYDQNQAVNLSMHYWAIDTAYSGSYLTPGGLDLSASLGYTINFENPTSHYRSGDVLHLDVALGHNLSEALKIGLLGYAVVQVTDDGGSGAVLGPFRSNIYALGPGVNYATKALDLQLRWYHELGARHHLEGDAVYLSAAFTL